MTRIYQRGRDGCWHDSAGGCKELTALCKRSLAKYDKPCPICLKGSK